MTLKNLKWPFAAALLMQSPALWALESDRNQPIAIEADQGSLDQNNQTTTFTGNVKLRQGTMYVNATRVVAHKDAAGNQIINASGSPVTFGQQLEKNGLVKGHGNHVHYESVSGIVTLTGNAEVQRGGDMASGHIIVYNTRTEVYTVNSAQKGRVHVIIQPQNKKTKSGKNNG